MLLDLVLVGALIILNAGFAGSELALISLREGQLQRLEQRGRAGRRVATLAREPNRYLATIQIGITLAGFLASATAAVSLAEPLVDPLSFLGGAAEAVAVILVTLVLTFFTLVLGELAPKRLAMQRAERWALIAAGPLSFVQSAARPVVWILGRSSDLVVRIFGGDPDVQREEVTEEEIRDLIVAQRRFTPMQRQIMEGALEMSERPLREILIPRRDVVALESHTRAEDGRRLLVSSGHSRAPVFEADLDDVSGVVHLRDLIDTTETVGRLARPVLAIPETVALINALRQMQAQRQALAIVTNEYGGMEGIVTIEDVIEELVGEIYDETDRDVRSVQREPDGSLVVPGSFPIHDLEDIGVQLPPGEYATIAGLVLDRLGHLPEPGETVTVDSWRIEVLAMEGRAIARLRLGPAPTAQPAPATEPAATPSP